MNGTADTSFIRYRALIAAAGITDLFTLIFWQRIAINPVSDLHVHIAYAKAIQSLADITSPHFLFQILVKALAAIPALGYDEAAALLLGGCYGAMAVMLAGYLQKHHGLSANNALITAAATLIASHVFLLSALSATVYSGYIVPTAYHNPTQQLNKLFGLAIWLLWMNAITAEARTTPRDVVALALLCILSAISKPSFLLAFLPLSGVLALYHLASGQLDRVFQYAAGIAIPSSIVLALQFWMTYGQGGGGIEFAPFAVFTDPFDFALRLPWSLLFPLAVMIGLWPEAIRSKRLGLAWAYLAIGIALSLLLAETGPRRLQGNFVWTAQTGVFLVYVETVLLMAARPGRPLWLWSTFGLHIVCGMVYAALNAFLPATVWL